MWEETSQECETGCQCSGLITDAFRINSGNNSTKRKHEAAAMLDFKHAMKPTSLNFNQRSSPTPTKRRILGEIQNQLAVSPLEYHYPKKAGPSTATSQEGLRSPPSPPRGDLLNSPHLNSPFIKTHLKRAGSRINRIFEDRNRYRQSVWSGDDATDMSYDATDAYSDVTDAVPALPDVGDETLDEIPEQYELVSTHKDVREGIDIESTLALSSSDIFGAPLSENEHSTNFTHISPTLTLVSPATDACTTPKTTKDLDDIEQSFTFISPTDDKCVKSLKFDSPRVKRSFGFQRQSSVNDYIFMSPIDIGHFSATNKPNTNKKDDKLKKSLDKENFPAKKSLKFFSQDIPNSAKKSLKFNETPTKNSTVTSFDSQNSKLSFDSTGSSSFQSPISTKLQTFNSENTTTSLESGFLDEPFLAIDESNSPKVADFGNLLSGPIKTDITEFKMKRPTYSRSLSYNPEKTRKTLSLMENDSPSIRKRALREKAEECKRPRLLRSTSETDAAVMQALNRAHCSTDLIGDFSRQCILPVEGGRGPLLTISPHTLAALLRGDYAHTVPHYQIIDCRYPYEYEGGHIVGAINRHTQDQVEQLLDTVERHTVLVLHCEYSIQRGPNMYRHLRRCDRQRHVHEYPSLTCPELYLLQGGYRDFYTLYPDLVYPRHYTPMAQTTPT